MVVPSHLLSIRTLLSHSFLVVWVSSLVLPKCLPKYSHRRCNNSRYSSPQLKLGYLESLEAITATTVLDHVEHYHVMAPPKMVPLSQPPLLLLQSSTPIISREGCSLLSEYFDHLKNNYNGGGDAYQFDKTKMSMAEKLLCSIHDVIDKVTNCPRHDGEMQIPRYVRYDSAIIHGDRSRILNSNGFGDTLLPEGLHVDTNNGQWFRHITAILYLTNNQDEFSMDYGGENRSDNDNWPMLDDDVFYAGGGTTFPLAVPKGMYECSNNLRNAAESLLGRGIQHTKGDFDENASSEGRILEKAGLGAFHRNVKKDLRVLNNERYNDDFSEGGVRVMPEAGKLIYFHNMDDGGMPDPNTFHGGEELISILANQQQHDDNNVMVGTRQNVSKTKSILVFFKEIPVVRGRGREGFAEQAAKSRSWTKEMYY